MAPLVLEWATLGEKHRHYNQLVRECSNKKQESNKLDSEKGDIENFIKIDIANNNKDVEYILAVFKSEDILYVSRAIKRSTWLINDQQYAHIINPDYLHDQLFPQMTSKAINKLLLHVRLTLKDEQRAEAFYKYEQERDRGKAFNWLPYCSVAFIEQAVKGDITLSDTLLKRLTNKSFTILEIYIKNKGSSKISILEKTKFFLNTHTEKYLDLVERSVNDYDYVSFGEKYTEIIMRKCPERIFDNFQLYAYMVHTETFVKYIKQEEIKNFLIKHSKKEKLKSYFNIRKLKEFVTRMPNQGRFQFVKEIFIDKKPKSDEPSKLDDFDGLIMNCSDNTCNSVNVYQWYTFAPFKIAFTDLKKLIQAESSPVERNNILGILVTCAGRNMQDIGTLLQYYHEKHINEAFKFKFGFIGRVLPVLQVNMHLMNDKTWNILNELFHSMEVYIESNHDLQPCIEAIILYTILHGQDVPEIIEKKFQFRTFKETQNKLKKEECAIVYNYLYNYMLTKIKSQCVTKPTDFDDMVNLINNFLKLLIDWEKELLDHPMIVDKIRELIKIMKDNSWKVDLTSIYNIKKSWRKHLFEESLDMCPSEKACVNALKHDPDLLLRHKSEVDALCNNDAVSLKRVHSKLRVYWPHSLAEQWRHAYLDRLDKPGSHKTLIRGLCVLLPEKRLLDIVKKYAPQEGKINWNHDDENTLSLRKCISKTMHIARPLIPLDAVLLYAKGDYLQYAVPSINAMLYNLSCVKSRAEIPKLLNAPVSLQKFGIRYAFHKMQPEELKTIFYELWKSSKNPTIRTVLFTRTYDLLCKEKEPSMRNELKDLLCLFIENLTADENKLIYKKLCQVGDVPIEVRAELYKKSYLFLKSLPEKANGESLVQSLFHYAPEIIHLLESEFVEQVLLKSVVELFSAKECQVVEILTSYLLYAKDEESQLKKYEQTLLPIMKQKPARELKEKYMFYYYNLNNLLTHISGNLKKFVIEKKTIVPVKMFTDILEKLESMLMIHEYYEIITLWKLTISFVKLVQDNKSLLSLDADGTGDDCSSNDADKKWKEMISKLQTSIANTCLNYLKEDVNKRFPSIYMLFGNALEEFFRNVLGDNLILKYEILHLMLREDFIESYLLVYSMWPHYCHDDNAKAKLLEIRKILFAHPSAELKMHYYSKFCNKSDLGPMPPHFFPPVPLFR